MQAGPPIVKMPSSCSSFAFARWRGSSCWAVLASALLLLLLTTGADAFLVGLPTCARVQAQCVMPAGRPLQSLVAMESRRPRLLTVGRMSSSEDEMMILTPENAELAIKLAREELGTLFGYTKENQEVGITGEVDFVDLDGVSIIVDLKGRFWHDRKMVLARVEKAIQNRIPECFEVRVRDPRQLEAGNDDQTSVDQFYRHGM